MHHADTPALAANVRIFYGVGTHTYKKGDELVTERGAWFFPTLRDVVVYIRGGQKHCPNTVLAKGMVFVPERRMPTIIEKGCSMQPDLRANPESEAAEWQRRHYRFGAAALGLL